MEAKRASNGIRFLRDLSQRGTAAFPHLLGLLAIALLLGGGLGVEAWQEARRVRSRAEPIPPAAFSRLIRDFSEEGGYFHSDNFISNETSYLHILDKLQELAASGGAYIGVGPEQNFTYIAKLRPRIAFLVDIRRQAVIQHLMYKAIFGLSENRAQFLSRLFSKPLVGKDAPGSGSSLEELLLYFSRAPTSRDAFEANLEHIEKTIEEDFRFPLSPEDQSSLAYVYSVFWRAHLNISFRVGQGGLGRSGWGRFPTLRDLLLETDLHGKRRNFLASRQDYDFLRDLHRRNRIIPVVGDFAGAKALAAVGDYLRENGYTVTAFYTSNVERYLFSRGAFDAFAENVRKLPLTEKSLFIRSASTRWKRHPAAVPGHRMTSLLQKMNVFLEDHEQGLYPDYWALLTTHFLSAKQP